MVKFVEIGGTDSDVFEFSLRVQDFIESLLIAPIATH
jgi:hypothetical protein